jgi:hypothetical protein
MTALKPWLYIYFEPHFGHWLARRLSVCAATVVTGESRRTFARYLEPS